MNRQDAKAPSFLFEPDPELDRLANSVIGAALEVHKTLGPGFLESAYEKALCVELDLRGLPFAQQVPVPLEYKGRLIGESRLDLLVDEKLVVELKTVESLLPVHKAQVLAYLKATRCQLGLLLNFNVPLLRQGIRRIVLIQKELGDLATWR